MIFYFTATGNSQYAAEKIAEVTNDRVISIGAALRDEHYDYDITADEYLGFVIPTFAWTLPGAVAQFIENMKLEGYESQFVYGVFTCGESSGHESAALNAMLKNKSIKFNGSFDLVMPDNFIIWSDIPSEQALDKILSAADNSLEVIISTIKNKTRGKNDQDAPKDLYMPISEISSSSGTSKFHVNEDCTACGLCQAICPMNCIKKDKDGHPLWEGKCTMCLACLHNCPEKAINHGKDTVGKGRYINPKVQLKYTNDY